MYTVRSITATRVAVTTQHATKNQAELEVKYRTRCGDHNAMIVQHCKHTERHMMSYPDARGDCLCLRCDTCGMVTNFNLPEEVTTDLAYMSAVEVSA